MMILKSLTNFRFYDSPRARRDVLVSQSRFGVYVKIGQSSHLFMTRLITNDLCRSQVQAFRQFMATPVGAPLFSLI